MIVNKWQALETWYSFCSLDVLPLILYPLMILDRFLYCYVDAVFTKLLANGDFLYSHSKYTYWQSTVKQKFLFSPVFHLFTDLDCLIQ